MFKIASCILVAVCINFQQDAIAASVTRLGSWGFPNPLESLLNNNNNNGQEKIPEKKDQLSDNVGSLGSWLDSFQDKLSDKKNQITDTLGNVLDDTKGKISDKKNDVLGNLESLLGDTKDRITDRKNQISDSLNSALDNIKEKIPERGNQMLDILRNVMERGNEITQKIGDGAIKIGEGFNSRLSDEVQKLKEKSEQFLKDAQNADMTSCTRLCKKGRAAVTDLLSKLGSCLLNETQQIGGEIRDLINILGELQKNMPEKMQKMIQCFKDTSNIPACISEGLKGVFKIGVTAKQSVKAAFQLAQFYPSLKFCCEKTLVQTVPSYLVELLPDAGMCVQSKLKGLMG